MPNDLLANRDYYQLVTYIGIGYQLVTKYSKGPDMIRTNRNVRLTAILGVFYPFYWTDILGKVKYSGTDIKVCMSNIIFGILGILVPPQK